MSLTSPISDLTRVRMWDGTPPLTAQPCSSVDVNSSEISHIERISIAVKNIDEVIVNFFTLLYTAKYLTGWAKHICSLKKIVRNERCERKRERYFCGWKGLVAGVKKKVKPHTN